jgi:predicted hydrocarbon binding protein
MAGPEVPIDVDPETGIWRTDGLPMIYLPRHFLVNNHVAVEEALGRDAYRAILQRSTDMSALQWCTAEAKTHGLDPEATFRHYFKRLSQRGWGQFSVDRLDTTEGHGAISIRNSVFTLGAQAGGKPPLCYMFEGFMTGAFRFLLQVAHPEREIRALDCTETQCAGDTRHDHCRFAFSG